MIAILILSILFQVASAFLALKLISITGRIKSWLVISISIVLMIIRRSVTLYHYLSGELISTLDWVEELVALATSVLLFLGILWIAPIFRSIQTTNRALISTNRALRTLSQCNQTIIREKDEKALMKEICMAIVEKGDYHMAWVGIAVDDESKTVLPVAYYGFVDGLFDHVNFSWGESPSGKGPIGTAIRTNQMVITHDIEKDPSYPWRSKAIERNYQSSITFPIKVNSHNYGVLNIYSDEIDAFDEDEVTLLKELADDLSYAIIAIKTYEQKVKRENQLFESQQRLGQVVEKSPFGIVEWSTDMTVQMWNPAAETIFGFTQEEVLGKKPEFIFPINENLEVSDKLVSIFSGKETNLLKCENVTKGRKTIICNWHNVPLFDKDGKLICVASFVEDVTARINAELARDNQIQRLNALRHIDISILGSFDLTIVLKSIIEESLKHEGVDAVSIYKYNSTTNELEFKSGDGFYTNQWQKRRIKPGEGLVGQLFSERKNITILDLSDTQEQIIRFPANGAEKFVSYIGIPLVSKGEIKGVYEVFSRTKFAEQQNWIDYLQMLAGQAAIGIDNLDQYEKLQIMNVNLASAYDKTIEGWSRTLELRDEQIEGHAARVASITAKLAKSLGFTDEEIIHIRRGALLHDIGKIILPDSILHKPGPLDENEWKSMKQHPDIAYKLLNPIKYLQPALNIPHLHHEKWDGSGYPLGLKGEQIPLEARIFAVVDVWDALSSDRPYRKAWQPEKITAYLKEQSGIHFDPKVVAHFLKMLDENGSDPIYKH